MVQIMTFGILLKHKKNSHFRGICLRKWQRIQRNLLKKPLAFKNLISVLMKVKAIVEIAKDGTFSCYCSQKFDDFELLGFGGSAEEAKSDFLLCYEEMKDLGVCEVDLTFSFVYDLSSFFEIFNYLKISKIAEKAGISPSLLRRYVAGCANAGEKQYQKILAAIRSASEELRIVEFIR